MYIYFKINKVGVASLTPWKGARGGWPPKNSHSPPQGEKTTTCVPNQAWTHSVWQQRQAHGVFFSGQRKKKERRWWQWLWQYILTWWRIHREGLRSWSTGSGEATEHRRMTSNVGTTSNKHRRRKKHGTSARCVQLSSVQKVQHREIRWLLLSTAVLQIICSTSSSYSHPDATKQRAATKSAVPNLFSTAVNCMVKGRPRQFQSSFTHHGIPANHVRESCSHSDQY